MILKAPTRVKSLAHKIANLYAVPEQRFNKSEVMHAEKQKERAKAVAWEHLNNMAYGKGRYRDWNMLAMRCNVGQYVASRYFLPNAALYGTAALDALREVHDQYMLADDARLSEDQLDVLVDALSVIDAMHDLCSVDEWSHAVSHIFELAGVAA